MKLFEIQQEKLPDEISQQCKPYLQMITPDFKLYRGTKQFSEFENPELFKTTDDRSPRDSSAFNHVVFDEALFELTGIRFRSNNVTFAIADKSTARMYGSVGKFYPVGTFDYVYFNGIDDFTAHISPTINDNLFDNIKKIPELGGDDDIAHRLNTAIISSGYHGTTDIKPYHEIEKKFNNSTVQRIKYQIVKNSVDSIIKVIKPLMNFNKNLLQCGDSEVMFRCKQYYVWYED